MWGVKHSPPSCNSDAAPNTHKAVDTTLQSPLITVTPSLTDGSPSVFNTISDPAVNETRTRGKILRNTRPDAKLPLPNNSKQLDRILEHLTSKVCYSNKFKKKVELHDFIDYKIDAKTHSNVLSSNLVNNIMQSKMKLGNIKELKEEFDDDKIRSSGKYLSVRGVCVPGMLSLHASNKRKTSPLLATALANSPNKKICYSMNQSTASSVSSDYNVAADALFTVTPPMSVVNNESKLAITVDSPDSSVLGIEMTKSASLADVNASSDDICFEQQQSSVATSCFSSLANIVRSDCTITRLPPSHRSGPTTRHHHLHHSAGTTNTVTIKPSVHATRQVRSRDPEYSALMYSVFSLIC